MAFGSFTLVEGGLGGGGEAWAVSDSISSCRRSLRIKDGYLRIDIRP